ncbi:class I SAM-dependent methyltransferase [Saccharothrix australiensis]|uniref:O-methyltransferase involved in polyketide biosynthesis n=1 Tax=Saccharothrix australiensis TaxID=2072 RepID=A0A495VVY9_9PSEU|nr:class I SAM-dependent methyltransferase [Saccharothrix australiensis]RKT53621.1 O-methyltransferase involved in polyketide biosynthesis [Saccharothrix australiensis]
MRPPRTRPELDGVPETALWTLYMRAWEARRPDRLLDDPKAVELVDALDYPFQERFGPDKWDSTVGEAIRTRVFDDEVRRFLRDHPDGTVVVLAEGLETQFWRVDNGRARWVSVDLAEVVGLRRRLLPESTRQRLIACSALDERWMDEVDRTRGVLITAKGLLQYFRPTEVHRLVATCAERFPGAAMVFEAPARWLSALMARGRTRTPAGVPVPPAYWGMDPKEARRLRAAHPGIVELVDLPLPAGRGRIYGRRLPWMARTPVVRNWKPVWIMRLRFGDGSGTDPARNPSG